MICTTRCHPASIDCSGRPSLCVSAIIAPRRRHITRAATASPSSSTSFSSNCLGSSSNSSSRASVVTQVCCNPPGSRALTITCDDDSCLSSTPKEQRHAGVQQQQPLQQQAQSPPGALASTAAVSRRSLASVTAAALLWGSNGLPAWALRTVELRDGSTADVYEHGMTLDIVALRGSIPQQWILEFRQALGKYAGFQLGQRKQLQEVYDELGKPAEKRSAGAADVVTLGDSWMAPAIRQRLIQAIPSAETYRWWRKLPRRWQQLVRRDPVTGQLSDSGPIWGCPYRWGSMLLAYKRDLVLRPRNKTHPIRTWSDLLQPALKGRVAFPDNPREFLGIAFKTFDNPHIGFNATKADFAAAGISADAVRERVRQLKRQARLFSSQEHVRSLMTGDCWVCVGSSTDLVPVSERTNTVELLAPADGTNLWADVWVVPAHAQHGHLQSGPSPILPSWLEFCISPARSEVLTGLKEGATPLLLPYSAEDHATIAAAAGAAAMNSPTDSSSSSSGRGWFGSSKRHQEDQQRQQELQAQQRQQQQQLQKQLQEQKQQELYTAAIAVDASELRLNQANNFMPPDSVLELSEFSLPRDTETLDFYNWLLS